MANILYFLQIFYRKISTLIVANYLFYLIVLGIIFDYLFLKFIINN